ncbi:hypothetical protein CANCADRAFT_123319 [Tortispora caseinolytica NRRL Y-17796]|uniref:Large ribosomal subunit protein mL49 n=1 Tax=Tortispora caseinolytica NRRL Y-17796 TaxID=767744 RepID=A0A1E4TI23_9ASCO|nr:hypothetical protein CANCADRAFT_123319 [Tortispora caseinolytica NRRL Y-17796]
MLQFRRLYSATAKSSLSKIPWYHGEKATTKGRLPATRASSSDMTLQSSFSQNQNYYFLPRTTIGNKLPIYTEVRNSGSRYLTVIRKIQGNPALFRHDLAKALQIPIDDISLRHSKIIIKGNHASHLNDLLSTVF